MPLVPTGLQRRGHVRCTQTGPSQYMSMYVVAPVYASDIGVHLPLADTVNVGYTHTLQDHL